MSDESKDAGEIRERLADLEHRRWSGWQAHVHSKLKRVPDGDDFLWVLPAVWVERWERQIGAAYADLSEHEKDSDRREADKTLDVVLPEIESLRTQLAEVTAERDEWKHLAEMACTSPADGCDCDGCRTAEASHVEARGGVLR